MAMAEHIFICDRCGKRMVEFHCKVSCPNCGNRLDCSNLISYLDEPGADAGYGQTPTHD